MVKITPTQLIGLRLRGWGQRGRFFGSIHDENSWSESIKALLVELEA